VSTTNRWWLSAGLDHRRRGRHRAMGEGLVANVTQKPTLQPATRRLCAPSAMVSAASRWPTVTTWPACSHPRPLPNDRDPPPNIRVVFPNSHPRQTSPQPVSPASSRFQGGHHADRFLGLTLSTARGLRLGKQTNTHSQGSSDNPIPQQLGSFTAFEVSVSKLANAEQARHRIDGRKTAGSKQAAHPNFPSQDPTCLPTPRR